MDTTLPSGLLEAQHHQIDQGIEGIIDSTGEPLALAAALALLREHVYLEEDVLFPPLAKTGLTMPVSVMQREHGEMWPMIRSLEVACAAGATAKTLRKDANWLLQRLKVHNTKEEEVVYTAADRYEADYPDASLVKAMAAARMPEGWTCAMAPH